jgi:hypothetical protein
MSFKSKDLAYEKKQPAFLQRIRNAQVDSGVDTDRHERQIARPRGAPKATNDDDDAPTYVMDDSNNTLSKQEYEALLAEEKAQENNVKIEDAAAQADLVKPVAVSGSAQDAKAESRAKQEVTEVGKTQKKRKAARVIGGDDEADQATDSGEKADKPMKKTRKKVKAVTLSFGGE